MRSNVIPYLIVVVSLIIQQATMAQDASHLRQQTNELTAFERIEWDVASGRLSAKEGLEEKLFRLFHPSLSNPAYRELPLDDPSVRCVTPLLIEAKSMGVDTRQLLRASAQQTQGLQNDTLWHLSPMKLFRVRYFTTGSNAVPALDENGNGIPDYPEQAALAADSSYRHMVTRLGFKDPFPLKNKPIIIVMEQLAAGTYGYVSDFSEPSAKIYVRSNYNTPEFTKNTDTNQAIGALKVTVAHELKHILQSVVIQRYTNPGSWIEMDATLMEEVVYDNVNDYYNYLKSPQSVFRAPARTVVPGNYYHSSWALYFAERFGDSYWVEVWKEFERQNPNPHQLNTMTSLVSAKSSTFAQELTRNYLWHLASGLQTRKGYGFSEGRYYPDIKLDSTVIAQNPDIQLDFQAIPPYAGRAYMLDFTKMPQGFPVNEALTFYLKNSVDNLQLSLGLLAFYKDSTVAEIIPLRTSAQELLVKPKLDYSRLEKIGMVLVNSGSTTTGGTISLKRQIQVGLNPDESLLPTTSQVLPSYPNPFNPRTSIPYTLSQAGYYRLDVIDMQGRIVQILEEGHRKPGTYEHVFEAQGLATGIYLVRLRAGQHLSTQKITLIK